MARSHDPNASDDPGGASGLPDVASQDGSGVPVGAEVIHIHDATGRAGAAALAWLRERVGQIGVHMALRGEVRVRIVDDAEMAEAHWEYCEIEGTTDVLTFDLIDGMAAEGEPLDTDIMVCLDEATRQASPRGHRPEHEILLYVLHGVLHCLGYDDHEDADFERMHAREDEVLNAIGVGAIFAKGPERSGNASGRSSGGGA